MGEKKDRFDFIGVFADTLLLFTINMIFFMILDFIFRYNFLKRYVGKYLTLNILFMSAFLLSVSIVMSALFAIIESFLQKKYHKYKSNSLAVMFSLFLFLYINLTYFKFYLFAYTKFNKSFIVYAILSVFILLSIFIWIKRELYPPRFFHAHSKIISIVLIIATSVIILIGGAKICRIRNKHSRNLKEQHQAGDLAKKSNLPNIIMITFDSLSSDVLSMNGYHKSITPNIESFTEKAYYFENMVSNSNMTQFSLSFFMGSEEIRFHEHSLVGVLRTLGYGKRIFLSFTQCLSDIITLDFTHNYLMKHPNDMFSLTYVLRKNLKVHHTEAIERQTAWMLQLINETSCFFSLWSLKDPRETAGSFMAPNLYFTRIMNTLNNYNEPLFIWAHIFHPHEGSRVPESFIDELKDKDYTIYELKVKYLDHELGNFLNELEEAGYCDNSIIIISSDHGSSRDDHFDWEGVRSDHCGNWLTRKICRIPLIIRLPGQREGKRIKTFCTQLDIAPTILEILGKEKKDYHKGESLIKYFNDNSYSEKIKYTIASSFFTRGSYKTETLPDGWSDKESSMIYAYWKEYEVHLKVYHTLNPDKPHIYNVYSGMEFLGVYNIDKDPECTINLLDTDRGRSLIPPIEAKVMELVDQIKPF